MTFEPGPNGTQGFEFFPLGPITSLQPCLREKTDEGNPGASPIVGHNPEGSQQEVLCLCWRGFWNSACWSLVPKLSRLTCGPFCCGCREPSANVLLLTGTWNLKPCVSSLRQSAMPSLSKRLLNKMGDLMLPPQLTTEPSIQKAPYGHYVLIHCLCMHPALLFHRFTVWFAFWSFSQLVKFYPIGGFANEANKG